MPKKIKILHIITCLDIGGSSTNTIETVDCLDKNKYDIYLIAGKTHDPDGIIGDDLQSKNIHPIFFKKLVRNINPFKDLLVFLKLYKHIKAYNYDIVHTHSSKAGILGRWAAHLAGVKHIVHTPHGHVFYGYFSRLTTEFFIWLEQITAKFTLKIICLTNIEKEEYLKCKIAPEYKFITIYSGIDLKIYANSGILNSQVRELIPENRFVFGTATRLDSIKGNSHIIKALPEVIAAHPKIHLCFLGDGDDRIYLEKMVAEMNLNEHVTFLGYHKDVPSFLNLIDGFVLASLHEGIGTVLLEAMAAGKPIIATNVGGIPELIENHKEGILVYPRNPGDIAEAMKKILSSEDTRDFLVRNAMKKVSNKFSIEKMIQDVENLYQNLLEE